MSYCAGEAVEGEFWFQLDGQPEKVLRAGESLTTPDHAIHNEGALGQAVKLTAVYVVEKGKPLFVEFSNVKAD